MSGKDRHPGDEIIIKAIVDEADLSQETLGHLSDCETCRMRKETLEADLNRFSSLADELMPQPTRAVNLEIRDNRKALPGRFSPAFAVAIILMITLAGLFFLMPGRVPHNGEQNFTVAELTAEIEKHNLLVAEVMELEENIMPDFYSVLTGDTGADSFDEFIDFVFPIKEEINGA